MFITSYPPRECGIATYSDDLIRAIGARFDDSFELRICALENDREQFTYPEQVKFVLNTDDCASFGSLADAINQDKSIA
ncbi:MAG TPA: mannosyltransferase, partial [Flavobacterium sp.]|nr:mannosyltransferase [Flavobacterium sp.]